MVASKGLSFKITAMDRTKKAFAMLGRSLKGVTRALFSFKTAIVGLVGVAGIGLLIKQSLTSIDNLGKMSKTLGIATKDLQAMRLASAIGGVELQTFAKASRQVSKGVFDFLVKGTGEALDGFKALGIQQADLLPIQNDTMAIMGLIADKLNELPDGTMKTAIAFKLLGGRAVELLPALEGGSKQMQAFRDEAELFGNALGQNTVKGVENFNDSVTRLQFIFTGLRDNIVAQLAPSMQMLVDTIREKLLTAVEDAGGGIAEFSLQASKGIIDFAIQGTQAIESFVNNMLEVSEFFANMGMILGNLGFIVEKGVDEFNKKFEAISFGRLDTQDLQILLEKIKAEMILTKEVADELATGVDAATGQALTGFEKLKKIIQEAGEGFKSGFLNVVDDSLNVFQQFEQAGKRAFKSFESAIKDFVKTGKFNFQEFARSVIADLTAIVAKMAVVFAFKKALAFTGLGGFFGGFLAQGGTAQANTPYIVGEKGAELIIPNRTSSVIPNDKLGGMGGNTTVNINVETADANGFDNLLVNRRGLIVNLVNDALRQQGKGALA